MFANNCNDEEVKRKLEAELRKLEYIPSIYSQDYFEDKSLSEFYASLPSIVPGSQAVSADTFSDFFFQIQGDRIYTFGDPELLSYLSYNANYPNVSYGKSSVSPEIVARAEEQKRYTGILHEFISVLLKLNAPANVKKLNQAHIQYCENVSRTLGGDRMFFLKSTTLKDMPVVVGAENELGCQTAFGDDKKLCSSEKKRAPVLEHLQDFSQSKSIELPGNLVENESNVYSCENSPIARKLLEIYSDKGVSFLVCADNASPSFIYYMRYENCFLQDVNALKCVASFLINIANVGGDTPVKLYTYSNSQATSRESQNINDYLAQLESREIPKKNSSETD